MEFIQRNFLISLMVIFSFCDTSLFGQTSQPSDRDERVSSSESVPASQAPDSGTQSPTQWRGLFMFGAVSGSALNTLGFKLLASGVFEKGAEFSNYAILAGVGGAGVMMIPMIWALRKQASKGPVRTWKRFATAAVVTGSLGFCAGALGLIGSAFGR